MPDTTTRLALPLLVPGQAQKELFHNEAILRLDLAVQASVIAVGIETPPVDPPPGGAWIVGDAPTGAWSGQAGAIAGWTDGGWRFVAPVEGMAVWDRGSGMVARRGATSWTLGTIAASRITVAGRQVIGAQQSAIAAPAGGGTVDAEARVTLASVLAALRSHGLIAE